MFVHVPSAATAAARNCAEIVIASADVLPVDSWILLQSYLLSAKGKRNIHKSLLEYNIAEGWQTL